MVGQAQGTTDGVASTYLLSRTFGVPDYNGTEPVGVVNTGATFNLYLDSVLQDPTTYDILTDVPCVQQVKFHSTPGAGHAITNDIRLLRAQARPTPSASSNYLHSRPSAVISPSTASSGRGLSSHRLPDPSVYPLVSTPPLQVRPDPSMVTFSLRRTVR